MLTDKIILALYGFLLLVGGFLGWRAGSRISLIMGLVFGILVLVGVWILGTNAPLGYGVVIGLSGLLAISFFMRFLKTQQFMPSGLLLTCSVIVLGYCIFRFIKL
jgi:uncharacterized membrane protein (UPF0136 family)